MSRRHFGQVITVSGLFVFATLLFGEAFVRPEISPSARSFADTTRSLYPSGLNPRSIRKLERQAAHNRKKKGNPTVADFAEVCPNVSPLTGALLKNAYPGHIQLSDPRASGFAFVCGSSCPSKFPVIAYYSDGTIAFKLGDYGTWSGNGQTRAYCAVGVPRCRVKKVVSESKKEGRDGKVYLKWTANSCRSATPGQRNSTGF